MFYADMFCKSLFNQDTRRARNIKMNGSSGLSPVKRKQSQHQAIKALTVPYSNNLRIQNCIWHDLLQVTHFR